MKTCPHCNAFQFDHVIMNYHRDGCPNYIDYKKIDIGNCSVCRTKLDNCNWSSMTDGLFCRECVEKSEKEKLDG